MKCQPEVVSLECILPSLYLLLSFATVQHDSIPFSDLLNHKCALIIKCEENYFVANNSRYHLRVHPQISCHTTHQLTPHSSMRMPVSFGWSTIVFSIRKSTGKFVRRNEFREEEVKFFTSWSSFWGTRSQWRGDFFTARWIGLLGIKQCERYSQVYNWSCKNCSRCIMWSR